MGHSSLLILFEIWHLDNLFEVTMRLTLLSIGHYFKKSNFIRCLKMANIETVYNKQYLSIQFQEPK
jgi:hypothetical protein